MTIVNKKTPYLYNILILRNPNKTEIFRIPLKNPYYI